MEIKSYDSINLRPKTSETSSNSGMAQISSITYISQITNKGLHTVINIMSP